MKNKKYNKNSTAYFSTLALVPSRNL